MDEDCCARYRRNREQREKWKYQGHAEASYWYRIA